MSEDNRMKILAYVVYDKTFQILEGKILVFEKLFFLLKTPSLKLHHTNFSFFFYSKETDYSSLEIDVDVTRAYDTSIKLSFFINSWSVVEFIPLKYFII